MPLRNSVLNTQHEILLPQENGKEQMTLDVIKACDVVLAETSVPSTGQGIELGWANAFNVPIICMFEKGSVVSSSIRYVTNRVFEYENADDMIKKLNEALNAVT